MAYKKFVCEHCSCVFDKGSSENAKRVYRFCTRTCAQRAVAPGNRSYAALFKRLSEKYGHDEAVVRLERYKARRSELAIQHNTGRTVSEETREKIAASCTGVSNVVKGKTYVEFYGEELAHAMGKAHSEKLKAGFKSGKLKPTRGTRKAPTYKGTKLRSLLEMHAIEFLEERDGLEFGVTLLYEDKTTRVQWYNEAGSHTYHPDLHDIVSGTVYEVKPAWIVRRMEDELRRKTDAARAAHDKFEFLTDETVYGSWSWISRPGRQ